MHTSFTLQKSVATLLDIQRKRLYGKDASGKDYRDSYILGNLIETFCLDDINKLLEYKEQDSTTPKTAKSVTLKSQVYAKLHKMTELLNLSDSELCRLIIYYYNENERPDNTRTIAIPPHIEAEFAAVRKALDDAGKALKAIENYYSNKANTEV